MIQQFIVASLVALTIVFGSTLSGLAITSTPVLVGDPFPPITLKNNLSKQDVTALRLPEKESIDLQDFPFEIILIEFLNVHCHTCKEQAPVFSQLWESLQSHQELKSRAALLGITVGNTVNEIKAFQKSFNAAYPLLADPSKKVFNSLGDLKGTPQTYLLEKDQEGRWYIVYHHSGAVSSHEVYLRKIEEVFKRDLEGIEPGYKVPQVLFTMLRSGYPAESFEKKRLLLYFPSHSAFPLDEDIRNTTPQMQVLLSLAGEETLPLVIIGSPNLIFPAKDLESLRDRSGIFLLQDDEEKLVTRFAVGEGPLISLVNDSGRIVYRASSLTSERAKGLLQGTVEELTPNLTERELLRLMQGSMRAVESTVERVEAQELENGEMIYLGFSNGEIEKIALFGRIVSKYSICDICHDTHFYYLIDQNGKLVYFNPIHVTKYGNLNWNYQDIITIKSRVMGKDLFKPLPFDPSVDAVSQATMSSYLIYEGLNETKLVLKDYSDNGFRGEYWRKRCLKNLQQLQEVMTLFAEKNPAHGFTLEDGTTLDREKLQQSLPVQTVPACPTKGNYLLMGESPVCSIHGMNLSETP
jgi:peroxiredoxin